MFHSAPQRRVFDTSPRQVEAGISAVEARANLKLKLSAGRFVGSGLKPLFPPKRHGVTPLADAARRQIVSCGKRRAACPSAPGASPQLSFRAVRRTSACEIPNSIQLSAYDTPPLHFKRGILNYALARLVVDVGS